MKKTLISSIAAIFFFAGIAHAAPVIPPVLGGTGTSTIPSVGQILVGQSNGTYSPGSSFNIGNNLNRPIVSTSTQTIRVGPGRECSTIQCALNKVPIFLQYPVTIYVDVGDYSSENIIVWPSYGQRVSLGSTEAVPFFLIGSTTAPSSVKVGSIFVTGVSGDYFGIQGFQVQNNNPYDNESSAIGVYGSNQVSFGNIKFIGGTNGLICYDSECSIEDNVDFGYNILNDGIRAKRGSFVFTDTAFSSTATGTVTHNAYTAITSNIQFASKSDSLTGTNALVGDSTGTVIDVSSKNIYQVNYLSGNIGIGGTNASTTPTAYAGTNGFFAIGNTSPIYRLQIKNGVFGLTDSSNIDRLLLYTQSQNSPATTSSVAGAIYTSSNGGSAYPFTNAGNLIVQPRTSSGNAGDFVIMTGSNVASTTAVFSRNGFVGIGTSTPITSLQVATSTANATTTLTIGKAGQTKGSCLELYDAGGAAVYAYVASGATSFTLSATSCK